MNISINYNTNNLTFNSRITNSEKRNIEKILLPFLEKEDIGLEAIKEQTGLSYNAIFDGIQKIKNMSAAKFFKLKKEEQLRQEMTEFHRNNTPYEEIAAYYGCSVRWVKEKLAQFELIKSNKLVYKNLSKNAEQMIKDGDNLKTIAKANNCSYNTAQRWVKNNLTEDIIRFRRNNKIRFNRKNNPKLMVIKDKMAKLFAEGKSITETARILNIPEPRLCALRDAFRLKTRKELAIERMEQQLPKILEAKVKPKLREIAEKFSDVSIATIRRFIKELTGKNYIEIRTQKQI